MSSHSVQPSVGEDRRIGRSLGNYRIVGELARGGMGRVYLARRTGHAGFERFFAVKVMSHQLADDHDALLMLLDEAHIASRLHHPNVVGVLDIGVHDEGFYLVMDYVEGLSLQELLRRTPNRRPPRRILPIILGALHGLHAVHTLRDAQGETYGVVHRDVSPHNLLVGIDGNCRVTDFGIAKAHGRYSDTQAGVYKGKLAYMAPEQLRAGAVVDCRADVWSAGVTLYFALTGVHPFRGENDGITLHSILGGEVAPPSRVGLNPPAVLDAVVMRALERDPARRYPSAEAFSEELRNLAIREDLYGAPGEIAAWVETLYGAQLAQRRTMVANLPRVDEPESDTGSLRSLPKLWAPDNTNVSQSARATPSDWRGLRASWRVEGRRGTKLAQAMVIAAAVGSAGWFALTGTDAAGETAALGVARPGSSDAPGAALRPVPASLPVAASPVREPPAQQTQQREHSETFLVDLRTDPRGADIWLDGRHAGVGELRLALRKDGREHQVRVSAAGYVPSSAQFRDVPPPRRITLERAPTAGSVESTPAQQTGPSGPRRRASGLVERPSPVSSETPAVLPPPPAKPAVRIIEVEDRPNVRVVE